jgi:hypothetical protein
VPGLDGNIIFFKNLYLASGFFKIFFNTGEQVIKIFFNTGRQVIKIFFRAGELEIKNFIYSSVPGQCPEKLKIICYFS